MAIKTNVMHAHQILHSNALAFITAGKALFTLRSAKTGNRFTYKVAAPKDQSKESANLLFVSVLTGPENTTNYSYIGFVKQTNGVWSFIYGKKSRIKADAPSVVAFQFVFNNLDRKSVV